MIPASFEYHAPTSLPEAIGLLGKLGQAGEEAKILSGGQSLLPLLKLRFARPGHLIDINRIPGLDYLKEEGGVLRIGALVREAALESSPIVRAKYRDPGRYRRGDRRSAGAQPGHGVRQPGARRSRQRSPGDDAGDRRRGRRDRARRARAPSR